MNTLPLVVTALDAVTTRTYTLNITRFTPAQSWKFQELGAPDLDGQCNLLEYVTGTDPKTSASSNVVQDSVTVSTQKYLRLTVTKNPDATDVTYEVQATSDLTDANSWSSAGLVIEVNTATELRVRDNVVMSSGTPRFMRVLVTRL